MLRRLAVLACLAAAPALASAQITVTESNDLDVIINIAEYNNTKQDTISFQWTVSTTTTTTLYDLFVSNTSGCPITSTTTGVVTVAIQPGITGTVTGGTFSGGQTAGQLLASAGTATCSSTTSALYFCVFTPNTQNTTTAVALATGSLTVDLLEPPAPVITSVTPGDSALNVSWTNGPGAADAGTTGAATSYKIFAFPTDNPAAEKSLAVTGGQTSGRITGLANDTGYTVRVSALTKGGNESPRSDPATGTPVEILDFWRLYHQNDQGREQGGCATGAAGLTALLALTPLLWRRRRSGGK